MAEMKRLTVEALKDHIGPDGRGLLPGRREKDGETIEGAVYDINEVDARKLAAAGIVEIRGEAKAKPDEAPQPASADANAETAAAGQADAATDADDGEWNMRMSPEMYLQQHPDGKYADKARRAVAAQKK